MKSILDPKFQYKPSFATDLKATFTRIRKRQSDAEKAKAAVKAEAQAKTIPLKRTA